MSKIIWQVKTPRVTKDFNSLKAAKDFLRKYPSGDIIKIQGWNKERSYFMSNGRIYSY